MFQLLVELPGLSKSCNKIGSAILNLEPLGNSSLYGPLVFPWLQRQAKVAETQQVTQKTEAVTIQRVKTTAGVAELADAQDLGSCGRKAVGVQIPPSAPS